jgi:protein-tyrosine phosphatase
MNRHISLNISYNTRDASGYRTRDGRAMRRGVLFRSDSLHALDAISQDRLMSYNIATMVDLRTGTEVKQQPSPFADDLRTNYQHLPVFQEYEAQMPPTLQAVYDRILNSHDNMRAIFERLAQPNAFPALVHCVVGKDRTGAVIALLQMLCDVHDSDIIADYVATETYLEPLRVILRAQMAQAGADLNHYEKLLKCPPEQIEYVISAVRNGYGGSAAYLRRIGLSDAQIDAIRTALME